MKSPTSVFLPRNLGGVVCCLAKMADGGAEVFVWDGAAWRPSALIGAGAVLEAPIASDRRLAELGIRPLEPEAGGSDAVH